MCTELAVNNKYTIRIYITEIIRAAFTTANTYTMLAYLEKEF
jgi:hypothetical protein